MEEDERYGIQKEYAHPRAIELIPEEFFWDCVDEFAPFGSDEGDMALSEYRQWRADNPDAPLKECLQWVIESVGEMDFQEYDRSILNKDLIKKQLSDDEFDDQQYIDTLDISVIGTGFGQLVDEGKIDQDCKEIIQLAIDRQLTKNEAGMELDLLDKDLCQEHNGYLVVLKRALSQA